jgi:hypothetical protein
MSVSVSGITGAVAAEFVLFENGKIRVVPMKQAKKDWEATFQAQPGTQFLIQLLGSTGTVTFDTNDDLLYTLPSRSSKENSRVRLEFEPISGRDQWDTPVGYRVRNTGKEAVDLRWYLNCQNPWESRGICSDSRGAISLNPGESFTQGLGMICAGWQLDMVWGNKRPDDGYTEHYFSLQGDEHNQRYAQDNQGHWRGVALVPASCAGPRQIKLPLLSASISLGHPGNDHNDSNGHPNGDQEDHRTRP